MAQAFTAFSSTALWCGAVVIDVTHDDKSELLTKTQLHVLLNDLWQVVCESRRAHIQRQADVHRRQLVRKVAEDVRQGQAHDVVAGFTRHAVVLGGSQRRRRRCGRRDGCALGCGGQ